MNIAAIDVGSNAIRLAIANHTSKGTVKFIHKYRVPIRLGADVFHQGKISKNNLNHVIRTFKAFHRALVRHKVHRCVAVATSALREASNREAIIEEIYRKSRIKIQLINGLQEGQLVFSAVRSKIKNFPSRALLVDIGGGSVELTSTLKGKPLATKSFPLGTVRLLEQLKQQNQKESYLPFLLLESFPETQSFISLHQPPKNGHSLYLIGTGGNVESMGKLKVELLKKAPSSSLTLEELNLMIEMICKIPLHQRSEKLNLRTDRADVIVPAMLVIKLLMIQTKALKLLIPYVGLKDGLINTMLIKERRPNRPVTKNHHKPNIKLMMNENFERKY